MKNARTFLPLKNARTFLLLKNARTFLLLKNARTFLPLKNAHTTAFPIILAAKAAKIFRKRRGICTENLFVAR